MAVSHWLHIFLSPEWLQPFLCINNASGASYSVPHWSCISHSNPIVTRDISLLPSPNLCLLINITSCILNARVNPSRREPKRYKADLGHYTSRLRRKKDIISEENHGDFFSIRKWPFDEAFPRIRLFRRLIQQMPSKHSKKTYSEWNDVIFRLNFI